MHRWAKLLQPLAIVIMLLPLMACTCQSPIKANKTALRNPKLTAPEPDKLNKPYKTVSAGPKGATLAEMKRQLQNASGSSNKGAAISALRYQALREAALSVGARGGLAERAQQLNGMLLNYEPLLAKIFDFYGLMLDDNILPPVLVEGRNTMNLAGNDAIRIADRNYKLIAQARFVTAPPNWREYLWMNYDLPEMPDQSLLPRNKPERIVWEQDLDEGWQAGLKQAELIYSENVARLVRDYKGMIMYRKLLAQDMVSAPYVAKTNMGVTGDKHDLNLNDKVLKITAFPELQSDSSQWKTQLYIHE